MKQETADETPVSRETGQTDKRGLECPKCGCRHFRVLHTRSVTPSRIRRRRECRNCGRRVTTYERFSM